MRIPHERKASCQKSASAMASLVVTKKMCCRSCVSSVETVQLDALERQLLTGRERQIMQLVLMTSPEGDHQANGLAEVGVREIKAQTRILRSQLEERLGSRIDEKDPLIPWTPRHAANCVSRYRIMDDGRTPDQRRCRKTWKRPVVEFGELVHFRPVGENNALRGGDQRLLRGVHVGREIWCCNFPHAGRCEKRNENCENDGTREWDRVFSATCVGVPWQLRPDQRNLVSPVGPEAEAEQGVALVIVRTSPVNSIKTE